MFQSAVPRSELAKMIRFIQQVGTFGHMGDGNLHPTFVTDETNAAEITRVELAMQEIFDWAFPPVALLTDHIARTATAGGQRQ